MVVKLLSGNSRSADVGEVEMTQRGQRGKRRPDGVESDTVWVVLPVVRSDVDDVVGETQRGESSERRELRTERDELTGVETHSGHRHRSQALQLSHAHKLYIIS